MKIATYDDRRVSRGNHLASRPIREGFHYVSLEGPNGTSMVYEPSTKRLFERNGEIDRQIRYVDWGLDGENNRWISIRGEFYIFDVFRNKRVTPVLP